MDDLSDVIKLIEFLKNLTIGQSILIAGFIIILAIIFFKQKKEIQILKSYIDFWNPTKIKKDLESYKQIMDEINNAAIEYYKRELAKSNNKIADAEKIINEIQKRASEIVKEVYDKPKTYNEQQIRKVAGHPFRAYLELTMNKILPPDTKISIESVKPNAIQWRLVFKDGTEKIIKASEGPEKWHTEFKK
jgi:hypothetical protein